MIKWTVGSSFLQVTVVPTLTVTEDGMKVKLLMVMSCPAAVVVVVVVFVEVVVVEVVVVEVVVVGVVVVVEVVVVVVGAAGCIAM